MGNKQPGGALSDKKADRRVATLVSLSLIRQIASATTGMLRYKWPRSQCAGSGISSTSLWVADPVLSRLASLLSSEGAGDPGCGDRALTDRHPTAAT